MILVEYMLANTILLVLTIQGKNKLRSRNKENKFHSVKGGSPLSVRSRSYPYYLPIIS